MYIGQVMHGEGMENISSTGKFQMKRDRCRHKENILVDVFRWLGVKGNKDIFRYVRNRTRGRSMIVSVFRQESG
jgi:hypothetical protein